MTREEYQREIIEERLATANYIVDLLVAEGPMTRGELTGKTGIPRTTIHDLLPVIRIAAPGFKIIEEKPTGRRGRPRRFYSMQGCEKNDNEKRK